MNQEKIFSAQGRDMTEKYFELAAELEPAERDRFIDFMEGAKLAIRCKRDKEIVEKAALLQQ